MMAILHKNILFVQTGGTIDKEYPRTIGGYNFEIGDPAIERIISKVKPSVGFGYNITSICRKDSQEILEEDREALAKCIVDCPESKIIVTHGTDTIIETATYLQVYLRKFPNTSHKRVIFVGSFIPESFKDSDADINLGTALGALDVLQMVQEQQLDSCQSNPSVYIALGGRVIPAGNAIRNPASGLFCHSNEVHINS